MMETAKQRSEHAARGGRAMAARYGRAGMRQLSRKAAKVRRAGDRTAPSVADVLATETGQQRAAAIARRLGVPREVAFPLSKGR